MDKRFFGNKINKAVMKAVISLSKGRQADHASYNDILGEVKYYLKNRVSTTNIDEEISAGLTYLCDLRILKCVNGNSYSLVKCPTTPPNSTNLSNLSDRNVSELVAGTDVQREVEPSIEVDKSTEKPGTANKRRKDVDEHEDIPVKKKSNIVIDEPAGSAKLDKVVASSSKSQLSQSIYKRLGNIENKNKCSIKEKLKRQVKFDALPLLLNACFEGELELVKKTIVQLENPNEAYYSGVTALHNAVGTGHFDIVKFLVSYGCDINAADSRGRTPLHFAASLNNLAMLKFLIENGASLFSTTLLDHKTSAKKCDKDREGFDECCQYLRDEEEKIGTANNGQVYTLYNHKARFKNELTYNACDILTILRKDRRVKYRHQRWWARDSKGQLGYVQRLHLGLYPLVSLDKKETTA